MTPQNQPCLYFKSCLYLWRGIRLETGQGIVKLLLVDLAVRAWHTHIVDGKSGQWGRLNLRCWASPQFLSLDRVLVEVMRQRCWSVKGGCWQPPEWPWGSWVTVLVQTRLQAFLKIGHSFRDFWKLLKMLPWVLCYWFVPIHLRLQQLPVEMKKIQSQLLPKQKDVTLSLFMNFG